MTQIVNSDILTCRKLKSKRFSKFKVTTTFQKF